MLRSYLDAGSSRLPGSEADIVVEVMIVSLKPDYLQRPPQSIAALNGEGTVFGVELEFESNVLPLFANYASDKIR